jgi:hypothetical protein
VTIMSNEQPPEHSTRDDYRAVLAVLTRSGFDRRLMNATEADAWACHRALQLLAPSLPPESIESRAIANVLSRKPQSFSNYVRRHPECVREAINATNENADPVESRR